MKDRTGKTVKAGDIIIFGNTYEYGKVVAIVPLGKQKELLKVETLIWDALGDRFRSYPRYLTERKKVLIVTLEQVPPGMWSTLEGIKVEERAADA